jgi:hypothetical protein
VTSADPPIRIRQPRRVDGAHGEVPDIGHFTRTWGARTDDHWYAVELTIVQLGMTEPQAWMRFDFRGPGELDPDNARAGINMRIGRAGLRAVALVLTPIDPAGYDALAAEEGS